MGMVVQFMSASNASIKSLSRFRDAEWWFEGEPPGRGRLSAEHRIDRRHRQTLLPPY